MSILFAFGCNGVSIVIPPRATTVRLVNSGDFPVNATVAYSDEQDIPEDLLTSLGTESDFTLAPGEARTLSRDCDELQAVMIKHADLMVVGQIGPETSSNVQRDGDDFGCGDTIVFTFTHSSIIVDFTVNSSVEPN